MVEMLTNRFLIENIIIRGYAMRKLLLGTTALAAAATLTTNAALADVSISGGQSSIIFQFSIQQQGQDDRISSQLPPRHQ